MKILKIIFLVSIIFSTSIARATDSLPKSKKGNIIRLQPASQFVDERFVDVWLPADYNQNKKYNVLYMHDGQMLYDSTKTWNHQEWQVDETIASLVETNKINETIIVGIWNNGAKRHAEFFPQKAFEYLPDSSKKALLPLMNKGVLLADNYLKFLVTELKPFIDRTFSTYTSKQHTFIAGSSMGGLISMYAICEYPNIFEGAACLSTHWIGTFNSNKEIPDALHKYLKAKMAAAYNHKFYFDYGTVGLDAKYAPYQTITDEIATSKRYSKRNYLSKIFTGAEHKETDWAKRLPSILKWLLGE